MGLFHLGLQGNIEASRFLVKMRKVLPEIFLLSILELSEVIAEGAVGFTQRVKVILDLAGKVCNLAKLFVKGFTLRVKLHS